MLTRRTVNVKDLIEDRTNFFRLWTTPHTNKSHVMLIELLGHHNDIIQHTVCVC